MVKLSQLNNEDLLITSDSQLCRVEDIKQDPTQFKDKTIFTAKPLSVRVDAKEMLDTVLEREWYNRNATWYDKALTQVVDKDVQALQDVLDKIFRQFSRRSASYTGDLEVEIDIV